MARNLISSVGTGYSPATFLSLYCPTEQTETPHSAGRVLEHTGDVVRLVVRCRNCMSEYDFTLKSIPAGVRIYRVYVTGEDGPHLPDTKRPLAFLEEKFEVVAASPQEAHECAEFAHSLSFAGHLVKYYIDGELHLNERF